MANQIALRLHGARATSSLGEENAMSHLRVGRSRRSTPVSSRAACAEAGRLTPAHLREWEGLCDGALAPPSVVLVENTHNQSGGRIWPLEEIDELRALRDELGVASTSTAPGS